MPATIRDVALAAGVSAATVSRVLNANAEVRAELRSRVLDAVSTLGYHPNRAARSLRTRATSVLGLIISDITNPFFTSMVRGVEDAAQSAGYSVVLANADEDLSKEARYLGVAAAEQMAGVVLSPASDRTTNIDVLTSQGIPVVTIDRRLHDPQVDSVTVNNHHAAKEATLHLLRQGCRRVACIAGPPQTTTAAGRLAGYRAALRDAGMPFDPALVIRGDFRIEGGREATRSLLGLHEPPDGLFISNNLMTVGSLEALVEAGVRLSTDIAVVGFDDMSWFMGTRPSLALVRQPTYAIGNHAANLLLRRIRGESFPPQRIVLPTTLTPAPSQERTTPAGDTVPRPLVDGTSVLRH